VKAYLGKSATRDNRTAAEAGSCFLPQILSLATLALYKSPSLRLQDRSP